MSATSAAQAANYSLPTEGVSSISFPGIAFTMSGHNHPAVIAALHEELEKSGPAMVQTHLAEQAGELGEKLCRRAGGRLTKVFFGSSGSEGVEAAIKFSRAHTGRTGLLYANAGEQREWDWTKFEADAQKRGLESSVIQAMKKAS